MIRNNDVDINEFIQFTQGGIVIAEFTQIRDALINRYKYAYGSDLDLSTGTADGLFINDLALIISNILQGYKNLYASLDVNTANGEYLDHLCALSNVTRLPASNSIATVTVTNLGATTWESTALPFIDKNGIEWDYNENLVIEPGESKPIQIVCSELGPIEAPAGWIYQTLEVTDLAVEQSEKAIIGENAETDSQLRARRARSNASTGVTVLESLVGGLLTISGIKDVYIENNTSGTGTLISDGVTVSGHSIYPVIRYGEGLNIDESVIGRIIYEKLTPGITTTDLSSFITTPSNLNAGEAKKYVYVPTYQGLGINALSSTVYWKKATGQNPTIEIIINPLNNFSTNQLDTIADVVMNYANNLPINSDLLLQDLLVEISGTDQLFLGRPTFSIGTITINGLSSDFSNKMSYYNYTIKEIDVTTNPNGPYGITIR